MLALNPSELLLQIERGNVAALGRLCRAIDDQLLSPAFLAQLYQHTRSAKIVGVTGSPGAGKSTLTDALIASARRAQSKVGVIAVDPTSPFTGGAILGDRIRMQRHFEDSNVFIRSVATRGALGGLSASVVDMAKAMAVWGADIIFLETVGVGQDEVDVMLVADSTCVVLAPGMGDDIQATKAGILEVADIFVVNKADRPGVRRTVSELEGMIALSHLDLSGSSTAVGHGSSAPRQCIEPGSWRQPICETVATKGTGVPELYKQLLSHWEWLEESPAGTARREQRALLRARRRIVASLNQRIEIELGEGLTRCAQAFVRGELGLVEAVDKLWDRAATPVD